MKVKIVDKSTKSVEVEMTVDELAEQAYIGLRVNLNKYMLWEGEEMGHCFFWVRPPCWMFRGTFKSKIAAIREALQSGHRDIELCYFNSHSELFLWMAEK